MHVRTYLLATTVVLMVGLAGDHLQSGATAAPPDIAASEQPARLYDPDPQHLWNRLHAVLWDRTGPDGRVYGHDRVDPFLWSGSKHLLEWPSHAAALHVLREFLDKHGEKLIDDPLKRAILQRDVWAIFDWLVEPDAFRRPQPAGEEAKKNLAPVLVEVIKRLALDPEKIDNLPDTYAVAVAWQQRPENRDAAQPPGLVLPSDLFNPEGPWVCVGRNGSDIIAPAHSRHFTRSSFQVFLKLPDGRQATIDYLTVLSRFQEPFVLQQIRDGRFLPKPNPALPQFPAGTEVAFVRSALVIDSGSRLRATKLTESVQLRGVANAEFTFSRVLLFGGVAGGLRHVSSEERDLHTGFNAHPFDAFERSKSSSELDHHFQLVMKSCTSCHSSPGVHSFQTFVGEFSSGRDLHPSLSDTRTRARGESAAIRHKRTRYDWGLLEGYLTNGKVSAGPTVPQ